MVLKLSNQADSVHQHGQSCAAGAQGFIFLHLSNYEAHNTEPQSPKGLIVTLSFLSSLEDQV